jgi:hypothetical protein
LYAGYLISRVLTNVKLETDISRSRMASVNCYHRSGEKNISQVSAHDSPLKILTHLFFTTDEFYGKAAAGLFHPIPGARCHEPK